MCWVLVFSNPDIHVALEIELKTRGIPFESQQKLDIIYFYYRLEQKYKADKVVDEKIIVEIKALNHLTSHEQVSSVARSRSYRAPLLNYLKATGLEVGVLINFGTDRKLEWKRMVLTRQSPALRD